MLLGANDSVTALGEVYLLSRYAREGARCTCGEPVTQCPFWHDVQDRLRAALDRPSLMLSEFPLTVEATVQSLHRRLPSINDALLLLGSGSLWKALAPASALSKAYLDASRNALQLFEVIAALHDSPTIVDSSKYALPMKALYLASPDRVRVIFLVRDGRAASLSLSRHHDMSFDDAVRMWKRYNWNLSLAMTTLPHSRRMLLRYEDLCTDPASALARISALIDAPRPLTVKPIVKEHYHTIGGNPMRFRREETAIVLEERWRSELSKEQRAQFERIAGPMNRRLGYQ